MFGFTGRMNDDECRELLSSVMDRMVEADWLDSYTFTHSKGFRLNWTERGGLAAISLKEGVNDAAMYDTNDRPMLLHKMMKGARFATGVEATELRLAITALIDCGFATAGDPASGIAWSASGLLFCDLFQRAVDELRLDSDGDGLLALCHIVTGWAPGRDSKIRFM